jgi:hypothetical protein
MCLEVWNLCVLYPTLHLGQAIAHKILSGSEEIWMNPKKNVWVWKIRTNLKKLNEYGPIWTNYGFKRKSCSTCSVGYNTWGFLWKLTKFQEHTDRSPMKINRRFPVFIFRKLFDSFNFLQAHPISFIFIQFSSDSFGFLQVFQIISVFFRFIQVFSVYFRFIQILSGSFRFIQVL